MGVNIAPPRKVPFRPPGRTDPAMRTGLDQPHLRSLSRITLAGLLVLLGSLCQIGSQIGPARAAWDLNTAWEIEKHLQDFIKGLPGGSSVRPPRLFLYRGTSYSKICTNPTESGISGPAYCPGDNTIYLEMGLGDQKSREYGDFGALSIVSHEFGHAYLMQTGQHHEGKMGELDADRFAGAFARYAEAKGLLEAGDLQEAQQTFHSVGDHAVGEPDHHGLPQERLDAFNRGYAEGFVGQPGSGTTVTPTSPAPVPVPVPVPQAPLPAPTPASPAPGVNPGGVVVALLVSIVVVIALVGSVVALIRHSSEED